MIKAKTTIIAGGQTFKEGQTVTGLSKLDKDWMKKAGYIIETATKKETTVKIPERVEEDVNNEDL